MKNTICNVILSVLNTKDKKFVENKINTIEAQLKLNEVEKAIIKDIKDSLFLDNVISNEFISEKYSYYVEVDENIIPALLSKDAIDSAIIDIRARQLKVDLSKQLLAVGSQISTMSPDEIKQKFAELHANVLIESRTTTPDNDLVVKVNPYEDLLKSSDGLSLLLEPIEQYAGKAHKGTIVSILAFTGSYKSTYSLNLAYKNAMDGHNVLYLALEDTGEKIAHRLVLNHIARTAVTQDKLIKSQYVRDGSLTKAQAKYYNEMHNDLIQKLNGHMILWDSTKINYQTFTDMTEVLRLADKQFVETTGKGLDALVIDQLSLLKYTKGSGKKFSYDGALLNDWVSYFREQALNFLDEARQIVVFLVAQTSRDSHTEASKSSKNKNLGQYDASCSSDAHEIERSSSTMITLYKDSSNPNTLLFYIPKARNGYQPDAPLQITVKGDYFHIGNLKFNEDDLIDSEQFTAKEYQIDDII